MLDPILNFPHQHGTMISGLCSNNYEDMLKELRSFSLKDKRIQFDMVNTFKIVHEMDRVDRVWLSLQ